MAIQQVGYKKPTAIQMAAIPCALLGRDVLGVAETGRGKTCSFVVPMLCYIRSLPPLTEQTFAQGPLALILAPTRELALQIADEARKFCEHLDYKVRMLFVSQSPFSYLFFFLSRLFLLSVVNRLRNRVSCFVKVVIFLLLPLVD
jgi:ATP-dependent RNA helicase DDX23/PRP28